MIEDFCKLNKTPSDATCLGEPLGGFFDAGCCCFTSLEVFHSLLFDVIPHPSENYHWVFTPILYFQFSSWQSDLRYFHFNFSGLFCRSLSGFERHFLPTGIFLTSTPSRHFGTFCDSDASKNTPSRILLCVCPDRVVLSGWRMVLNYLCCSCKTIGLSIALVSHEVSSQN